MGDVKNMFSMLLLVSAILLGTGMFVSELGTTYNAGTTYKGRSLESLNVSEQTREQVDQLQNKIDTTQPSLLGFTDILATGVFTTLKLMLSVPKIFGGLITDSVSVLGLPGFIGVIMSGIVILYVVMAIIKGITKTDP